VGERLLEALRARGQKDTAERMAKVGSTCGKAKKSSTPASTTQSDAPTTQPKKSSKVEAALL